MKTQPSILLGLIGDGIQASLTPAMHEREAGEHGLRCIYKLIDLQKLGLSVEALPELLTAAERMGFAGLNITFPCKQAVIPLLSELSENARALGAVNTVILRDGRRMGHNTDLFGFAENLRRGLPHVKRGAVVQMGAGGAGSAVAHALLSLGIGRLTLFDTDMARAERLALDLVSRFGEARAAAGTDLAGAMASADGLVNATPVGMAKFPGMPVPAELLRPALWVAEIVYFPIETELLASARALGCRTVDGGGMAVFQAVRAFSLFTGLDPDAARMLRCFCELQEMVPIP
jgi:shikimate dehydrogenase